MEGYNSHIICWMFWNTLLHSKIIIFEKILPLDKSNICLSKVSSISIQQLVRCSQGNIQKQENNYDARLVSNDSRMTCSECSLANLHVTTMVRIGWNYSCSLFPPLDSKVQDNYGSFSRTIRILVSRWGISILYYIYTYIYFSTNATTSRNANTANFRTRNGSRIRFPLIFLSP